MAGPAASAVGADGGTDGGAGNSIQIFDAATGTIKVLESSASLYQGISWRARPNLAVLHHRDRQSLARHDSCAPGMAWLTRPSASNRSIPDWSMIPAGRRVADGHRLRGRDGATLLFGLADRAGTRLHRRKIAAGK
jgi:hypothetical protein